jgi:hypothetical protein
MISAPEAKSLARRNNGLKGRLAEIDWDRVAADLDVQGFAVIEGLLGAGECSDLLSLYRDDALFRRHVIMDQHGYGRGEYKYFAYPVPGIVGQLRSLAYPRLARVANRWSEQLGSGIRYPATLDQFLERCHDAGQLRPTPLLLKYGPGDFNCLHQDLYGEHAFPLQMAILLEEPGRSFTGGEFVLVEQRPRMQSRATVVPLTRGDAVIFAGQHRPVRGRRGFHRVNLRHGVSELSSGRRHTLGIIFHDAK